MTDIENIYNEMQKRGIKIVNEKVASFKSVSLQDEDGRCMVAVDESKFETNAELHTALLHENAHCAAGTFYNEKTPMFTRGWLEYKTDKYVAKNNITKESIITAQKSGWCDNIWELAEYFNISVAYMKKMMYIHFSVEFAD